MFDPNDANKRRSVYGKKAKDEASGQKRGGTVASVVG